MNCNCFLLSTRRSLVRSTVSSFRTLATEAAPKKVSNAIALSSCEAGTVFPNINVLKDGTDPIALEDSAYPAWLWKTIQTSETKVVKKGKKVTLSVEEELKLERDAMRKAGRKAIKGRNDLG